jgi:protein SMG9
MFLSFVYFFLQDTNPLAPPLEMKSSVKLLDDLLQFSEISLEYLLDQSEFLVIGCIGLQGVGKSTIMSLLAGNEFGDINK